MSRLRDSETTLSYEDALTILERLANASTVPELPKEDDCNSPVLATSSVPLPSWSEQSFRDLVEALPDAVVVIDRGGSIVLVNAQTERLFGYPREELLGHPIEILVPERFREGHVAQRNGYLSATNPQARPLGGLNVDLFGRRKDGSEFPTEISLSPLRSPSGLLVTSVVRDITERKRYEAKFRTLIENIPAVTFVAAMEDSGHPELYVSPQIEHLLGFSQKEWLEDPILWHRQLHPDDQERWTLHFAPTCATGVPFSAVYRFISKDGRVVWVQGSANGVRDDKGKILFLQGVAFDITPIKEAEEERERFFSLSLDLFCIAGLDGYFKRVNHAFTDVLGHSTEELLTRPFLDFIHPDDREATRHQLAGLARGIPTERFENRYQCKDGSYRWLQWVAAPFTEGQLCYAAARDVTREKADEEALREEARLAMLRASICTAITHADSLPALRDRCLAALTEDLGASFAHIWIFNEKESALELIRGHSQPRPGLDAKIPSGVGRIGAIASEREPRVTNALKEELTEVEMAWGKGLVSFAGYPLLVEDHLVGVFALFSGQQMDSALLRSLDLVAVQLALGIKRLQAEEELRKANAELERRVQERTEELARSMARLQEKTEELNSYAYHATHDLKEPLRTVLTHTQRLVKQSAAQLPSEAMERVNKVIDGVASMQELLEKLREYAHVNQETRVQPVDCLAAVYRARASLQGAIEETGAEVDVVSELPTVPGRKEHLELLFQNLISNALKYRAADRSPRIEIGAQAHADGWLFWVRDNGMGIEPKYWQRIFGMGEQLNSRSKYGGWGYGLAICEKTVIRHGGRIWVASEPGKGSTFYFTLSATEVSQNAGMLTG